jgi:thiol-disulfide isomerase/thioredoxin
MTKRNIRILTYAVVVLGLVCLSAAAAQTKERVQGYREFLSAMKIEDLHARIGELEKIKAAYPQAKFLVLVDNALIKARTEMAEAVEPILELQKSSIQSAVGIGRVLVYYYSSMDILDHSNLAKFDKGRVTRAVLDYCEEGLRLARDPEFMKVVPPDAAKYLKAHIADLYIPESLAFLNEGQVRKALDLLDRFKQEGGLADKGTYYALGRVYARLDRNKEAFDAYFEAAVENHRDSVDRARELYGKLHGGTQGFDALLEAKDREIPFRPLPYKPAAAWMGKTVLAELFTGSECPPCVAADLGFDGLIEAYGPKYVAVLKYHLPIPRPDPMMNHATRLRAQYYGVSSTPQAFFDGAKKTSGGGGRTVAEEKYRQFSEEVNALVSGAPAVKLDVKAALKDDSVVVEFKADKTGPGADFNLALVQTEEKFRGGNGVVFHKMVVREFVTLDEAALQAGSFAISIPASEAAAAERVSIYEQEMSFTFPEKHSRIDRSRLWVVFFAQEKISKEVLNAAISEVK